MKKPLTFRCLEAITTVVGAMSELDARAISATLTRAGSEFQFEVMNREGSRTPIAIVRDGSGIVVAWAATHQWSGMQTVECFTHPEQRGRGYCRAAVSLLLATGALDREQPVAVFSPVAVGIASQAGFADIRLYEFRGESWRLSSVLATNPLRWSPPGGASDEPASAGWSHSG
jgi:hypothetical protein